MPELDLSRYGATDEVDDAPDQTPDLSKYGATAVNADELNAKPAAPKTPIDFSKYGATVDEGKSALDLKKYGAVTVSPEEFKASTKPGQKTPIDFSKYGATVDGAAGDDAVVSKYGAAPAEPESVAGKPIWEAAPQSQPVIGSRSDAVRAATHLPQGKALPVDKAALGDALQSFPPAGQKGKLPAAPKPKLWLPELTAAGDIFSASPIPEIPISELDHSTPVALPYGGAVPMSAVKTVVNTITGQASAKTAAIMLASAGLGEVLAAGANSPKFIEWAAQIPWLSKVTDTVKAADVIARAAVPAGFAAQQGYEAGSQGSEYLALKRQATEARKQGKTADADHLDNQAENAAVGALTNLVMGAASLAHAVSSGVETVRSYPGGVAPEAEIPVRRGPMAKVAEEARPEGVDVKATRRNVTEPEKVAPAADAAAEALAVVGRNAPAYRWLERAEDARAAMPVDTFRSGETRYMSRAVAQDSTGKPIYRLADESGNEIMRGYREDVAGYVRDNLVNRATQLTPEEAAKVKSALAASPDAGLQELHDDVGAALSAIEEQAERYRDIRDMEGVIADGGDVKMHSRTNESATPEQRRAMLEDNIKAHRGHYEKNWEQLAKDLGPEDAADLRERVEAAYTPGGRVITPAMENSMRGNTVVEKAVFEKPNGTGKYTVSKVESGRVSFVHEDAAGQQTKGTLPMGAFARMVGIAPKAADPAPQSVAQKPQSGNEAADNATGWTIEERPGGVNEVGEKPWTQYVIRDASGKAMAQTSGTRAEAEARMRDLAGESERATATPGSQDEPAKDDLYQKAVALVRERGKASTSTLQRELRMGYGAATALLDRMEKEGIVGPADGSKPREVLSSAPKSAAVSQKSDNAPAPEAEAPETVHKNSSTQAQMPPEISKAVAAFAGTIPDAHLNPDEPNARQPEDDVHVTVKYRAGDDPAAIAKLLEGQAPIPVTLGNTSVFENEDGDVLKVDVDSPELHALNAKIAAAFPHKDDYPDYKPHVTIAYLKPGKGAGYSDMVIPGVTGETATLRSITFSGKDGKTVDIPLTGKATAKAADNISPASKTPDVSEDEDEDIVSGVTKAIQEKRGEKTLEGPASDEAAKPPREITAKTRLKPAEWRKVLDESLAALQRLSRDDPHFSGHFQNMTRAAGEVDFKKASKLQRRHNVNNTSPYTPQQMIEHYAEAFGFPAEATKESDEGLDLEQRRAAASQFKKGDRVRTKDGANTTLGSREGVVTDVTDGGLVNVQIDGRGGVSLEAPNKIEKAVKAQKPARAPRAQTDAAIHEHYQQFARQPFWGGVDEIRRAEDPKPGDVIRREDGEHVVTASWRTATAKESDGHLHVSLMDPKGHGYGVDGKDIARWIKSDGAKLERGEGLPEEEMQAYRDTHRQSILDAIRKDEEALASGKYGPGSSYTGKPLGKAGRELYEGSLTHARKELERLYGAKPEGEAKAEEPAVDPRVAQMEAHNAKAAELITKAKKTNPRDRVKMLDQAQKEIAAGQKLKDEMAAAEKPAETAAPVEVASPTSFVEGSRYEDEAETTGGDIAEQAESTWKETLSQLEHLMGMKFPEIAEHVTPEKPAEKPAVVEQHFDAVIENQKAEKPESTTAAETATPKESPKPKLAEGDRVRFTRKGKDLTGTVRSVNDQRYDEGKKQWVPDETGGTVDIDTDQVRTIGGRVPIGRIESYVPVSQVQKEGAKSEAAPVAEPERARSTNPDDYVYVLAADGALTAHESNGTALNQVRINDGLRHERGYSWAFATEAEFKGLYDIGQGPGGMSSQNARAMYERVARFAKQWYKVDAPDIAPRASLDAAIEKTWKLIKQLRPIALATLEKQNTPPAEAAPKVETPAAAPKPPSENIPAFLSPENAPDIRSALHEVQSDLEIARKFADEDEDANGETPYAGNVVDWSDKDQKALRGLGTKYGLTFRFNEAAARSAIVEASARERDPADLPKYLIDEQRDEQQTDFEQALIVDLPKAIATWRDWLQEHLAKGEGGALFAEQPVKKQRPGIRPAPLAAGIRAAYFTGSGVSDPKVIERAEARQDIGVVVTPQHPEYTDRAKSFPVLAVDNGVFAKEGFVEAKFRNLLQRVVRNSAAKAKVRFVVAPDVLIKNPDGSVRGDAAATLAQFPKWSKEIRDMGLPVAFAAQDGLEDMLDQIPWDGMDVLFIAGSTDWKLGRFADRAQHRKWRRGIIAEARKRDIPIHVGRVNSAQRLNLAVYGHGALTVDGNHIGQAPQKNLAEVEKWLDLWNQKPVVGYESDDAVDGGIEESVQWLAAGIHGALIVPDAGMEDLRTYLSEAESTLRAVKGMGGKHELEIELQQLIDSAKAVIATHRTPPAVPKTLPISSIGSEREPYYTMEGYPVYSPEGKGWVMYEKGSWAPLEQAMLNGVRAQFKRGELTRKQPAGMAWQYVVGAKAPAPAPAPVPQKTVEPETGFDVGAVYETPYGTYKIRSIIRDKVTFHRSGQGQKPVIGTVTRAEFADLVKDGKLVEKKPEPTLATSDPAIKDRVARRAELQARFPIGQKVRVKGSGEEFTGAVAAVDDHGPAGILITVLRGKKRVLASPTSVTPIDDEAGKATEFNPAALGNYIDRLNPALREKAREYAGKVLKGDDVGLTAQGIPASIWAELLRLATARREWEKEYDRTHPKAPAPVSTPVDTPDPRQAEIDDLTSRAGKLLEQARRPSAPNRTKLIDEAQELNTRALRLKAEMTAAAAKPAAPAPSTTTPVPDGLAWEKTPAAEMIRKEEHVEDPAELYRSVRARAEGDYKFIEDEPKRTAAVNGKKGAPQKRREIWSETNARRNRYVYHYQQIEQALGFKAAEQLRAEVEGKPMPEHKAVPDKEGFHNFWHMLRRGDSFDTAQGPLVVTLAHSFTSQPIIPGGPRGQWGAIGPAHREVSEIETRNGSNGVTSKYRQSELKELLYAAEGPKVDPLASTILFNASQRIDGIVATAKRAIEGTPGNASIEIDRLEKSLVEAREQFEKLKDAGESQRKLLGQSIADADKLISDFKTKPQSQVLPPPGPPLGGKKGTAEGRKGGQEILDRVHDDKIIAAHSGTPLETKQFGTIPTPLPDVYESSLRVKPDHSIEAAQKLVGGFYRAYGGGIDRIESVDVSTGRPIYTVMDANTGEKRKHGTVIDPRTVTFKAAEPTAETSSDDDDIVAGITAALKQERAPTPAPAPAPKKQPSAPRMQTPTERKAAESAPVNPLKAENDAAREQMRKRLEAKRNQNKPNYSREESKVSKEDLFTLAKFGAEYMIDGATEYGAWREKILANDGDILEAVAEEAGIDRDGFVRRIHGLARRVAANFGVTVAEAPAETKVPDAPKAEDYSPTEVIPEAQKLIASFREIVNTLVNGKLVNVPDISDNVKLMAHVKAITGRGVADGTIDTKQIYDLLETAINQEIAQTPWMMSRPVPEVLKKLRYVLGFLPTQAIRSDEMVRYQQFSTPPTEALVAARVLAPTKSDLVGETSAGTAGLASFARAAGARVLVNEINPRRAELLGMSGYTDVTRFDGEQFDNLYDEFHGGKGDPTAILMNPPFSAAGERGTANTNEVGYRHVMQALRRLRPGGRLVAILGEGARLDAPNARDFFKRVREIATIRANVGIDGQEYAKYGTTFGNRIIVIDKVPSQGNPPLTGDFKTLEEAWNALEPIANDRPEVKRLDGDHSDDSQGDRGPLDQRGSGKPDREPGTGVRGQSGDDSGRSSGDTSERGDGRSDGAPAGSKPGDRPAAVGKDGSGSGDGPEAEPIEARDQAVEAGEDIGDYVAYKPQTLPAEWGAKPHGAIIVETQTMAAVAEPPIHLKPNIPAKVIMTGDLSDIQLAAIAHTIQAHEHFQAPPIDQDGKPTGEPARRLGFFNGDGTGVGKGRMNAGTAVHYWRTLPKGKRRMVWVSFNEELAEAARDDLDNVGGKDIPLFTLGKSVKPGQKLRFDDGVLFIPYSKLSVQTLTQADGKKFDKSATKEERGKGQKVMRRLQQLMDWAGEEPLIIFDEAHKAKNATAAEKEIGDDRKAKAKPTLTALAVIELQNQVPKARVVYTSATGFSDVSNMAYANRLGVWGPGTSFKNFEDFRKQVDDGGIAMMEIVAQNLKAQGKYLSRFISYAGVQFDETRHDISPEQHKMIDRAGDAWRTVIKNFRQAAAETTSNTGGDDGPDPQAKSRVLSQAMSQLWGAELRFYRSLYTAMKIPTLIKIIDEAREPSAEHPEGKSVVISVMETGKAQQDREMERLSKAGIDDLEEADVSPVASLYAMVESNFPTLEYETVVDPETGEAITKVKMIDVLENGVLVRKAQQNAEALRMKEALLKDIEGLKGEFPDSALDQIINKYGSSNVAEMTKRSDRLVRNADTGERVLESRGSDLTKTNLSEMAAFQDGRKNIAIISNAASTGISLHSSLRAKNQRQRVHILLQLKWSADMTMQDLGRTHRTNQRIPPHYILLSLNVEGEKRFAATVARRLEQLGALSRGERTAGGGAADFSKYNFESKYGIYAIDQIMETLYDGVDRFGLLTEEEMKKYPALADGRKVLEMMGLYDPEAEQGEEDGAPDVPVNRFFNRLMILPIDMQNQLFGLFMRTMEHHIEHAKRIGTFDAGAEKIKAAHLDIAEKPIVVFEDPVSKAQAVFYKLTARNPRPRVNWLGLNRQIRDWRGPVWIYRVKASGRLLAVTQEGHRETNYESGTQVTRHSYVSAAGSGGSIRDYELTQKDGKYEKVDESAAETRAAWDEQYQDAGEWMTHSENLITGSVLPIWGKIQERRGQGRAEHSIPLKVKIAKLDSGKRLIGAEVEPARVAMVLKALGHAPVVKPEEVMKGILRGRKYDLMQGGTLKRSKVSGEDRIELEGAAHFQRLFRQWGLYSEQIRSGQSRWFVPTGEAGLPVLQRVLKELPIRSAEDEEGQSTPDYQREDRGFSQAPAIRTSLRNGTVYTNAAGMDALAGVWGDSQISGMHMAPPHVEKALRVLRNAIATDETAPKGLAELVNVLAHAGDHGSNVVVTKTGRSLAESKQTLRHERFHLAQAQLPQHLGAHEGAFLKHPLAQLAGESLRALGYTPKEMSFEIGAHLAGGQWERLGLSRQQAEVLFFHYATLLHRAHGGKLKAAVSNIAPAMQEVLRRATTEESEDPGESPESGGSGEEGPGAVSRGLQRDVPSGERTGSGSGETADATGELEPYQRPSESQVIRPAEVIAREIQNIQPQERETPAQMMARGTKLLQEYSASMATDRHLQNADIRRRLDASAARVAKAKRDFEDGVISASERVNATADRLIAESNARAAEARKRIEELRAKGVRIPEFQREEQQSFLKDETGTSTVGPRLAELGKWFTSKFGDDGPRVNYGGLLGVSPGSLARTFLPGRNLAEVERASKPVFEAALPAASAEAITSTVLQSAIPAVRKALEGSPYTWEELKLYYTESRLQGLRNRWQNFADQAEEMEPDEMAAAVEAMPDGSPSPFLDLLSKIEGKAGLAEDLGQVAASLVEAHEWAILRDFLQNTFATAAERVTRAMDPEWFDAIHEAVSNDPRVKEADRIYGATIEQPMSEAHAVNEGVFSDALGPANRYIPLISATREMIQPPGRRLPFRKPKNPGNAFATGLSPIYSQRPEDFAKKLSTTNRANYKAQLITVMESEGWLLPENKTYRTAEGKLAMKGPDGEEYLAVREEVKPGRTIITGRKAVHVPAKFGVMPAFMSRGLKATLAREPMDPDAAIRGLHWLNMIATVGPLELLFHSAGVMGALYANTPFLGKTGLDKALSVPLVKWFGIRAKLWRTKATTPENVEKLHKMALAGALPARSGKVTYSEEYAKMTGAKRERFSFGPTLYGPNGLDTRARILMYDIWEASHPNGDIQSLHHFVNQIGNYTPELQGRFEQFMKQIGIGPFATAGMTRGVNAIQTVTGTGPGKGDTLESKLWWWLTSSAVIAVAAWILAHKFLTGKDPIDHPGAKLFAIPLVPGGSGRIDKYRHSKLGNALWGSGSEVGYLNFAFLDNPLAMRGARLLGAAGAFNTMKAKGNAGQIAEAAQIDIMNGLLHPMLGPAARAAFAGVTGEEASFTGLRDGRSGAVGLRLFPATPPKSKPGMDFAAARSWAALKELNSLTGEGAEHLAEYTGFASPVKNPIQKGNWLVQSLFTLNPLTTGLVQPASNPNKKREMLRMQRNALR